MKLLITLVLATVGLVVADEVETYGPITVNYHEIIGIPEAARIKAAEESNEVSTRIVGGSQASLGQFPYQAGLVILLRSGQTSVCGASLLSNTRLVTAAHCWWDGTNQASQFTVVLGSVLLFSGGTRIVTTNVEMHANYNTGNLHNDVAMIYVGWAGYTNNIQPIALPSDSVMNNNFAGNWVTASGFGRTSDSSGITTSQFLSHVSLQVITNAVCQNSYGPSVIASTICTSGAGRQGTCGGDSGGPVAITSGGQRFLAGIVSFGYRFGCQLNWPAGHARVTAYRAWILARM